MAQKVDLMVIGVSDDVSAVELTDRLVAEFGQPAEAFGELVSAACAREGVYAAQSGVTLETATQGRQQLEKLGVVCQMVVDGQVLEDHSEATDVAAVENSAPVDNRADLATEEESDNHLPVTDGLDIVDVNFSDELGSLGVEPSKPRKTESDSLDTDHLPASNGLELVDVSFGDELELLVDTPDAPDVPPTASTEAVETEISLEPDSAPIEDMIEELPLDPAPTSLSIDEKVAHPDGSSPLAGSNSSDQPAVIKSAPSDPSAELELTLSDDDSQPLTKPKVKSTIVPDDGGLTLSLEDDIPAGVDKAQGIAAIEQLEPEEANPGLIPDDGGLTLSFEDDIPGSADKALPSPDNTATEQLEPELLEPEVVDPEPELQEPEVVKPEAIQPEPPQSEPELSEPTNSAEVVEQPAGVRDTRKAEPAPLIEEPETEEQPKEDRQDTSSEPEAVDTPASVEEQQPQQSSTTHVDQLLEDLSSTGGLVLHGQAAAFDDAGPDAAKPDPAGSKDEVAVSAVNVDEEVLDLPVRVQEDIYAEEGDHLESLVVKKEPLANLYKAAAAAVVLAVAGGGAFFVLQPPPVVAESPAVRPAVASVNENRKFEIVEENSLNAAIERTTTVNNPDQYSTEELIAYLSENIGENAQLELENYVNRTSDYDDEPQDALPGMGAAIPADSKSVLWMKNRVKHAADTYFDRWAKREVDLKAFVELQERLIRQGDLDVAIDVSESTQDKWFAVMSQQRLARAYQETGNTGKAREALALAESGTYSIPSDTERVIVIADYGLTEYQLGLREDSLDSFLKASILARSLATPESKTVGLSAIAEYYQQVNRIEESAEYLDLAMTTAYELPVNTAARDLAIRQVALTEARLGLTEQATEHANLIVDPFAAVSTLHGIALELERTGDLDNARLTLNMAYRAGSLIQNSEKRDRLLEKVKLAGG